LTFSKAVTLDAGAITLVRTQGGALMVTPIINTSDSKTFTLTFSGATIVGGSLADGVYNISIDHTKVHSDAGVNLNMDFSRNFHRVFGDLDGDGDCDATDQLMFRNAMIGPYKWYLDYDGNNAVDNNDYLAARTRNGTRFTYTP